MEFGVNEVIVRLTLGHDDGRGDNHGRGELACVSGGEGQVFILTPCMGRESEVEVRAGEVRYLSINIDGFISSETSFCSIFDILH